MPTKTRKRKKQYSSHHQHAELSPQTSISNFDVGNYMIRTNNAPNNQVSKPIINVQAFDGGNTQVQYFFNQIKDLVELNME